MSPRQLVWALAVVVFAAGGVGVWFAMDSSPSSDAATATPSQSRSEVAWLDSSEGVTVLRNPAMMSDAAQHTGSFSIGDDGCLYVTVVDDSGSGTYLAGVGPTTIVSREQASVGQLTYAIGAKATFTHTEIMGEVPEGAFSVCTGATTAYGLELAPPAG